MKIYALEPVFINGQSYAPGESVDVDENTAASVLSAGRGTLNPDLGAQAAKNAAAVSASAKA